MNDFDDMQIMRRRVLDMEQQVGDLGEIIGALKAERARLYIALRGMVDAANNPDYDDHFDGHVIDTGIAALQSVKID